jgi:uncharacterized protein
LIFVKEIGVVPAEVAASPNEPTLMPVTPLPNLLPATKTRILGFDLARAYAIFGMYVVNFNTVFGSHTDHAGLSGFLNRFNGNSSSTFVILAGMGVARMTNRPAYSPDEKKRLRATVLRRSWFLFGLGLLLCLWWPADILHFYGGYLHVAALLLFRPKATYLWAAAGAVLGFHVLFALVPYERGWNFETLQYPDFWTVPGFLRNTLYNGWNPIFPWLAYFLLGMWLGRLDWSANRVRWRVFGTGLAAYVLVEVLRWLAGKANVHPDVRLYLTADYLPPFLPFLVSTAGFAAMLLPVCMVLGDRFEATAWAQALARTGQLTLTHYVGHLTLGMGLFALLTDHPFVAARQTGTPVEPIWILAYAVEFFALSVWFSTWWRRRYPNGPLETAMRRWAG